MRITSAKRAGWLVINATMWPIPIGACSPEWGNTDGSLRQLITHLINQHLDKVPTSDFFCLVFTYQLSICNFLVLIDWFVGLLELFVNLVLIYKAILIAIYHVLLILSYLFVFGFRNKPPLPPPLTLYENYGHNKNKKILKSKKKSRPTDPLKKLLCNPKHTYFFFGLTE